MFHILQITFFGSDSSFYLIIKIAENIIFVNLASFIVFSSKIHLFHKKKFFSIIILTIIITMTSDCQITYVISKVLSISILFKKLTKHICPISNIVHHQPIRTDETTDEWTRCKGYNYCFHEVKKRTKTCKNQKTRKFDCFIPINNLELISKA